MTFDYSYTFGDGWGVVSGSLLGDRNGDFVQNISSVSLSFNGIGVKAPMSGTVFMARVVNGQFVNDPLVSFDPIKNNFLFINGDIVNGGSFDEYFWYQLNDPTVSWHYPALYHFDTHPAVGIWSLTEHVAVPEASTYVTGALLLLPFAVQGIRRLRNRKHTA